MAAIGRLVSGRHDPILDRNQMVIRLQGQDVLRYGQTIEVTEQPLLEVLRADKTIQIEATIGGQAVPSAALGDALSVRPTSR